MTYAPISDRTKRARDRVVIDGVDVTFFRDSGVQDVSYELTEPYGYGPGSLTFPSITILEEHKFGDPAKDLPWLRDGAEVRIDRVLPAQGIIERGVYRGLIFAKRPANGGLTVELAGEASGRLSQRWRPQTVRRNPRDVGLLIARAFGQSALSFRPKRGPETGVVIDDGAGGIYNLGWVDSCLELAYDGDPWTVMPTTDKPSVYEMRRKDTTTIHATVWADGFGVQVDVVDDLTEKPNAGYGAGVSPDGAMWLNAIWPDLGPEQVPPFPGLMVEGDDNEGVFVFKQELIAGGVLHPDETAGGFTAATVEAVITVQEAYGLPATGDVDSATWAAIFGDAVSQQRAGSGQVMPLVERNEVRRFNRTANGSIMGFNPDYDGSIVRVDRHIDFGPGVKKQVARKYWRKELARANRSPNYYGTITLDADVWEGEHTHGAAGTVLEKERVKAGWNILVRKPGRDLLFHIASARRNGSQVVLTVDTKARDALHVGEMIARDEEARRDFSRNWRAVQKSSRQTHDALTGWYAEDGAGRLRQKVVCPGNQWTVFPVIGGQEGQVMRTTVKTEDSPAAFVMAVAGAFFLAEGLTSRVPNPFALDADDEPAWNDQSIQEWLHDEKRFAYVIGDATQPGGYWPKKHTNRRGETTSHPITGIHKDWMTWPYVTYGNPMLWVAIYPDRDTVIKPQELFRGSRTLGG